MIGSKGEDHFEMVSGAVELVSSYVDSPWVCWPECDEKPGRRAL